MRIVEGKKGKYSPVSSILGDQKSLSEIVWHAAMNEPLLKEVLNFLKEKPLASGRDVGTFVESKI